MPEIIATPERESIGLIIAKRLIADNREDYGPMLIEPTDEEIMAVLDRNGPGDLIAHAYDIISENLYDAGFLRYDMEGFDGTN